MQILKFKVTNNKVLVLEQPDVITSGTVGLVAQFDFGEEWRPFSKIAVFQAGSVTKTIINPEEEATVPWEVLERPNVRLKVGVRGTNADGSVVIPTVWADVCTISAGVRADGDPSTDPTLPVWQTIMARIDSCVEGSGVSDEHINSLIDAKLGVIENGSY